MALDIEFKQSFGKLAVLALSTFIVSISGTFSQVIAVDLMFDLSPRHTMDYQWMLPTFFMGGCAAMAICGAVIDRYGRMIPYAVGSVLFLIGSAILAVAPDMDVFNTARVIQGAGFGAVMVTCMGQVVYMIKDFKARYAAHGILSLGYGAGMLFGIFLGQVAQNVFGWRGFLWILFAAQLLLTYPCIKILTPGEPGTRKADIAGGLSLAGAIAVFVYVLQKLYMEHYVMSASNWATVALLVLFISLFVFFEVRDPESMLRRKLDDRKMMIAAMIFITMLGVIEMASVGWMVKVSLFVYHLDVLSAGPCFIFVVLGAATTAISLSKKIDETGHTVWFLLACIIAPIALFSVSLINVESSIAQLCVHLYLIGLAIGCTVTMLNATIQNRTDVDSNGGFVSWSIMVRTAGLWLGYNLYQAIADGIISVDLGPTVEYWNTVLGINLPCDSSLANMLMTPLADAIKMMPGLVDIIGSTYITGVSTGFIYMGIIFAVIGIPVTYFLVRGRKLV